MTAPAEDKGAAAVVVVVLAAFLVLATATLSVLARLLVEQRRVEAAADLAALAAASALQHGADPCGSARDVADRNGAGLRLCGVSGEEVRVTAEILCPALLGRPVTLTADARAGPVGSGVHP